MRQGTISNLPSEQILYPRKEEWDLEGLCAETDPEAFFPDVGGTTKPAKAICMKCDVKEQCLEYALRIEKGKGYQTRYGIWGGLSAKERHALAKERGEKTDDSDDESDGGREDQQEWEMEPLLPEEEEVDWRDLQFV